MINKQSKTIQRYPKSSIASALTSILLVTCSINFSVAQTNTIDSSINGTIITIGNGGQGGAGGISGIGGIGGLHGNGSTSGQDGKSGTNGASGSSGAQSNISSEINTASIQGNFQELSIGGNGGSGGSGGGGGGGAGGGGGVTSGINQPPGNHGQNGGDGTNASNGDNGDNGDSSNFIITDGNASFNHIQVGGNGGNGGYGGNAGTGAFGGGGGNAISGIGGNGGKGGNGGNGGDGGIGGNGGVGSLTINSGAFTANTIQVGGNVGISGEDALPLDPIDRSGANGNLILNGPGTPGKGGAGGQDGTSGSGNKGGNGGHGELAIQGNTTRLEVVGIAQLGGSSNSNANSSKNPAEYGKGGSATMTISDGAYFSADSIHVGGNGKAGIIAGDAKLQLINATVETTSGNMIIGGTMKNSTDQSVLGFGGTGAVSLNSSILNVENKILLDSSATHDTTPTGAMLNLENNSVATTKSLDIKNGIVHIGENSTLITERFIGSENYNGSQLYISDKNGVLIVGNDPLYTGNIQNWPESKLQMASKDPSNYQNGILSFLGNIDANGQAQSLNLSTINFGLGTNPISANTNGIIGSNTLTIINTPLYIYNSINTGALPAIIINSSNISPFTDNTSELLLAVDNDIKVGDKIDVLQNSSGNFTGISESNSGWLAEGNTYSTSRLLTVNLAINGDKLTATFNKADTSITLPDLSDKGQEILDDLISGNSTGSSNEFFTRAADERYIADKKTSAQVIESALRIGALGGIHKVAKDTNSQAAMLSYDRARMVSLGFKGQNSEKILYSSNNQDLSDSTDVYNSFTIWASPIYYQSKDKDYSLNNSFSYGHKLNVIAGAFGLDYTYRDNLILGAQINFGKGDVKHVGNLSNTKNDFNFFGISAYAGYRIDNLTLTGDVSFTHTKNKINQNVPTSMLMGNLKTNVNGNVLGVGMMAEYLFSTNSVDISPYLGIRWLNIKHDSYTANANPDYAFGANEPVVNISEKALNIFEIPLGVRFDGKFNMANGELNPFVYVGGIFLANDVNSSHHVNIAGTNANTNIKMRQFDRSTLDIGLGTRYHSQNFDLQMKYNFQTSKHRKSHSVGLNFIYNF